MIHQLNTLRHPLHSPTDQNNQTATLDTMTPNHHQPMACYKLSTSRRWLLCALPSAVLVLGGHLITSSVLAATSGNLTTINVTNVGPATVFAGAQKVAIYSCTLQVKTNGANDTLKDIRVQYAGDNTADLSSVYLYRESGSIPGSFNPAQDTLLATDATAAAGEFDLNSTDFAAAVGTTLQFYIVVDLSSSAVDGRKIDFQILADKISFNATWPPASEVSAGTWNPAGFTTIIRPSLSIDNSTVTEGDSGTTNATFTVSLSAASSETVTVNFTTANGSATAPADYATQSGTLTFSPGDTSKQILVQVNGDTADEADETFFVNLSNPTNASIADNQGLGTIIDDDDPPTVSFNAATSSGSESTTTVSLPVSLAAASGRIVTVDYAVTGGSATGGGVDYTLASGTLSFAPGVISQNIGIAVMNDTLYEGDETISVTLSSPTNASLGAITNHTYTVLDNDNPPTVSFTVASSSGAESVSPANLAVSLSNPSIYPVTVDYAVSGGNATGGGVDFTLPDGTLTFAPGVTTQNIAIDIVDDALDEPNETILVTVSNPTNATLGATTTRTYTITDNDNPPAVNLSLSGSPLAEAGGVATVTATLSAVSAQTVTVNLAFSGTATLTSDYTHQRLNHTHRGAGCPGRTR